MPFLVYKDNNLGFSPHVTYVCQGERSGSIVTNKVFECGFDTLNKAKKITTVRISSLGKVAGDHNKITTSNSTLRVTNL